MDSQVKAFLASIEEGPAYSKSTRLAYASDLRVFLAYLVKRFQETLRIEDLNEEVIAGFLKAEIDSGRRKSTLLRRLATLRRFVKFLVSSQAIPADRISLDSMVNAARLGVSDGSSNTACLSNSHVASLLEIMKNSPRPRAQRDQAILMLLLETGLSVGSLTALDLVDIDLGANCLRVRTDGGRAGWFSMGAAGRYVEKYILGGRQELIHRPDDPALFVSQMNGRVSRQGIWQILNHWGRSARLPFSLSPRLLRNTAAWRMAQAGRPVTEIQALFGHSNPLSTRALMRRLNAQSPEM